MATRRKDFLWRPMVHPGGIGLLLKIGVEVHHQLLHHPHGVV